MAARVKSESLESEIRRIIAESVLDAAPRILDLLYARFDEMERRLLNEVRARKK